MGAGDGARVARAAGGGARVELPGCDRAFGAADGAKWRVSRLGASGREQPLANGDLAVGYLAGARSGSRGDAKDAARGGAREWRSNVGHGDGGDVRGADGGAGAGGEFACGRL